MALNADSIILGPWHGGVRYDIPVEEAKAHELSDMGNTRIGTGGQVITRPGTDSFNDLLPVNSAAALLMCAEYNVTAETTQTVIVAGNKIYDYSSNVWTEWIDGHSSFGQHLRVGRCQWHISSNQRSRCQCFQDVGRGCHCFG